MLCLSTVMNDSDGADIGQLLKWFCMLFQYKYTSTYSFLLSDVGVWLCTEKFHPFNASNLLKFVVPPDSHVWEIPGLKELYPTYTLQEILNGFLRSLGHDPRCYYFFHTYHEKKTNIENFLAFFEKVQVMGMFSKFNFIGSVFITKSKTKFIVCTMRNAFIACYIIINTWGTST